MLTPKRYLESSLQLRYDASCSRDAPSAYTVKVVLSGCLVHYRLVVSEAFFWRLSFCLKPDFNYSKT